MGKRVKFKSDDSSQTQLGATVLANAYRYIATAEDKITAVEKAFRLLTVNEKNMLPSVDSFVRYLTNLVKAIESGTPPEMTQYGHTIVLHKAYQQIISGPDDQPVDRPSDQIDGQVSVDDLCPLEAAGCEETADDGDDFAQETERVFDSETKMPECTAKYFIDKHYLLLKQLMGVG